MYIYIYIIIIISTFPVRLAHVAKNISERERAIEREEKEGEMKVRVMKVMLITRQQICPQLLL